MLHAGAGCRGTAKRKGSLFAVDTVGNDFIHPQDGSLYKAIQVAHNCLLHMSMDIRSDCLITCVRKRTRCMKMCMTCGRARDSYARMHACGCACGVCMCVCVWFECVCVCTHANTCTCVQGHMHAVQRMKR